MQKLSFRFIFLLCAGLAALTPQSSAQTQALALRANDMFDLRLEGVPDPYGTPFNGAYTVSEDGTVGIPLLDPKNPIKAAGLTSSGLAKVISDRLIAEKIFTHPLAVITLPNQTRTVSIGGAGMKGSGTVNWTPELTLKSAMNHVGGAGDYANLKKIKISRGGKIIIVNLLKSDKDPSQNPKLEPGDEVEVPE